MSIVWPQLRNPIVHPHSGHGHGLLRMLAAGAFFVTAGTTGVTHALDLATLDRVSVMMSMDQVRAIAGPPAETRAVTPELTMATWAMDNAPGMLAAGGIFDGGGTLIAQAYVFAGSLGADVPNRMRDVGYRSVTGTDGVTRLYGRDDDTARPLVAIVDDRGDTTTVFAYAQSEYERRSAAGTMPAPGAAATEPPVDPVGQANVPGAAGTVDPGVRAALMSGIGFLGGQLKPIEKSTTLSSHSSTTRNPDGSVTTRSSSVKASVGVDPAGVANALMMLFK